MKRGELFVFGAVLLALIALSRVLPDYSLELATRIAIFALFAMSLDLMVGYTGLASLGHAAFFGIAGYAVGLLALGGASATLIVPLALAVALVVSLVFAALSLRATGVYFLMLTLALAQIVWGLAYQWRSFTGGDDGLPGIARPAFGEVRFSEPSSFLLLTAGCFVAAAVLLLLIVRSPFGLGLQGIRESPTRMAALGYNVWLHRYIASNIAALFAGLAGMLHAWHNGIVTPGQMGLVTSAEALLMVILGGAGTIIGPMIGALVIVLVEFLVNRYTERWVSVLGAIYILVVVAAPQGLYAPLRAHGVRLFHRVTK